MLSFFNRLLPSRFVIASLRALGQQRRVFRIVSIEGHSDSLIRHSLSFNSNVRIGNFFVASKESPVFCYPPFKELLRHSERSSSPLRYKIWLDTRLRSKLYPQLDLLRQHDLSRSEVHHPIQCTNSALRRSFLRGSCYIFELLDRSFGQHSDSLECFSQKLYVRFVFRVGEGLAFANYLSLLQTRLMSASMASLGFAFSPLRSGLSP